MCLYTSVLVFTACSLHRVRVSVQRTPEGPQNTCCISDTRCDCHTWVESLCLRPAWSSLLGDCLSYCLMFFSRNGETHFTEPLSFYWFMSFPEISDSFDRLTVPTFIHVQLIKHQSPVPWMNTLWTSGADLRHLSALRPVCELSDFFLSSLIFYNQKIIYW